MERAECKTANEITATEYKKQLKDWLFERIAQASMSDELVSIYADFGYMVAQKLLREK